MFGVNSFTPAASANMLDVIRHAFADVAKVLFVNTQGCAGFKRYPVLSGVFISNG